MTTLLLSSLLPGFVYYLCDAKEESQHERTHIATYSRGVKRTSFNDLIFLTEHVNVGHSGYAIQSLLDLDVHRNAPFPNPGPRCPACFRWFPVLTCLLQFSKSLIIRNQSKSGALKQRNMRGRPPYSAGLKNTGLQNII